MLTKHLQKCASKPIEIEKGRVRPDFKMMASSGEGRQGMALRREIPQKGSLHLEWCGYEGRFYTQMA